MKKMISWNVNGLRAAVTKGFKEKFEQLDADIFCIQETKLQEGQIDLEFPGYKSYWNYAQRKGYSGTAIFTKEEPISVNFGIGIEEHDKEGRVITLEFEDYYVITVYTPNSQSELVRLQYRMKWEEEFKLYLKGLEDNKNDSRYWYNLACIHCLLKDYKNACDCFYCSYLINNKVIKYLNSDEEATEFKKSEYYNKLLNLCK